MTNVNHISGPASPARLDPLSPATERRIRASQVAEPQVAARGADQVDLSEEARQLDHSQGTIRDDLVARIRAEIRAGTYDTPERLDRALEGLAQDIL